MSSRVESVQQHPIGEAFRLLHNGALYQWRLSLSCGHIGTSDVVYPPEINSEHACKICEREKKP